MSNANVWMSKMRTEKQLLDNRNLVRAVSTERFSESLVGEGSRKKWEDCGYDTLSKSFAMRM